MTMGNLFVPESITIQNFNNIVDTTITFGPVTIVTGKNGSGKTSVAEAMGFCLTGEILRDVKADDIITVGATSSVVTMRGKYGNVPVEITRKRTRHGQELTVVEGEGDARAEVDNPKEYLKTIVSPSEFYRIFYINGHDVHSFAESTSSKTGEMLDKLFSIDSIDNIVDQTRKSVSGLETRLAVARSAVETIEKKKELIVANAIKPGDATGVDALQKELEETNAKIPATDKLLAESMNDGKLSDLKDARDTIEKQLQHSRSVSKNITDNESMKRVTSEKLAKLKAEQKELEKSLDIAKSISVTKQDIDKMRDEIVSIDTEIISWKELPSMFEQVLEKSKAGSDCPLCLSKDKRPDALKNMETMLASKKAKLPRLLTRKNELKSTISSSEERLSTIESLTRRIRAIEMDIAGYSSSIASYEETLSNLRGIHVVNIDEFVKNKANIEIEIDKFASRRASLTQELSDLKNRSIRLARYISDQTKTRPEWTLADEKGLGDARSNMEKIAAKIDSLAKIVAGFKKILSTIRQSYMAIINPNIIEHVKKLTSGNTNITKFEIVPEMKERGSEHYYYSFKVSVNGDELKFSSLSTGQRAIILISMILNIINMSSSTISMIIIDEIDNSGIDRESVLEILKIIVKLSGTMKVLFIDRNKSTIKELQKAGKEKQLEIPVHVMQLPKQPVSEMSSSQQTQEIPPSD